MKTTYKLQILLGFLVGALAFTTTQTGAQTEPLGGQPVLGSKPSVPDLETQVAYQRAFEAVVWAMPASAIYRFRVGALEIPGAADNVVFAYSAPLTQLTEAITGNTVTPYIVSFSDLRNGPVVLELPARTDKASLYGQIVDAWQATLADVGPVGLDKGAGGKYLLIPPGYNQPIPDGYFPVQSSTYRVAYVFRSVPGWTATDADAYAYSKTLQIYPLSEAADPKPTQFVDPIAIPVHTLPFYDIRALQDIHDIISVEPVRPQDKVMMGMLASIGIERGKPFNPQGKFKAAMERGVTDAYFYMQQLDAKLFASNLYWPDRHWSFVMVPDEKRGFEFVTDEAVQIDKRAAAWFFFTFYPKILSDHVGTVYLAPTADADGKPLEPGKTYRLHVVKDVPARQFWSLTLYDNATWNFVINPLKRNGLGSLNKGTMKINDDGSVDLYVGPKAPTGFEQNWLPTMGKKPYLWFRFYAPGEAFWNKTFKLPDVELVKSTSQ
jgi:hypothetical protein